MKKNFKRTLAKVMAVALTVSMVGVASTDADAAKKIKLSSKSISVAKGATKKVTIKNVKAKKVKKLTVKSKDKKIATVKKAGKTAFKVTGKKAGKSTKVTVKVKVGKKTTKLTLKVKVTKAKKVVPTAAPATTAPTAAPAASASASAAPAASASTKPATKPSATPVAKPSATPDEATPVPTAPTQPPKPTSPAKQMPELNLREEAATEWSLAGSYGTAIFNTDDTVDYSSQPWAAEGSCYNNGIAWYIDPVKKGKVDLSAYTDLELTIKTDAEIAFLTWGGSTDPEYFWDKKDVWGAASKTVENADGSKTITYNLEKIFGSATKVKKAVLVGLTLKSDKDGDENAFSARTATIYGIKFVNNGNAGNETGGTETSNVETSNVETPDVDTADVETKDPTEAPEVKDVTLTPVDKAIKTTGTNTYKFAEMTGHTTDFDITNYSKATVTLKGVTEFDKSKGGKICLNDTSSKDENVYNWGYGNGLALKYYNNFTVSDDDDKTMVITFDLTSIKDLAKVDCITSQVGGSFSAATLETIVFSK